MSAYVLNESKMFCDIADGVAIIINSETGIYYGMNSFGTAVFENILKSVDTDKIVAAVKKITAAPTDLDARFAAFIDACVKFELIIPAAAGGGVMIR